MIGKHWHGKTDFYPAFVKPPDVEQQEKAILRRTNKNVAMLLTLLGHLTKLKGLMMMMLGWLSWLWLICRMSSTWSSWQPAILAILATTPQNGKAIRTKATEWGLNLAWGNKKEKSNLLSGKQMGMQSGWGQKMQQKCKQHLIHGNKIWSTTTKYGICIWCLATKSMNTIWSKTFMLPSE